MTDAVHRRMQVTMQATGRQAISRSTVIAVYIAFATLAVAFGAFKLALLPLDGDQSIFALAGEVIASGGQIYVDYWDVKQPGIFLFYAAAGSLFGFTNLGIHLFELAYWLLASLVIWRLMRPMLSNPWLASSVPLLLLAIYFGHAGHWHATQLEVLMAAPLAIAILLVCRALSDERRAGRSYLLAGICAGVTLVFKLPLAPAYLALFAAVWLHLFFVQGRRDAAPYIRSCLLVALGTCLALLPVLVWLAMNGLVDELLYVTFHYPREVIAAGIADKTGLLRIAAGIWFVAVALAGPLVVIALYLWLDRKPKPLLFSLALVSAAGIVISILIQIYSLWEYHFQMLFMPAAILCVVAVDRALATVAARSGDRDGLGTVAAVAVLGSLIASQIMASDWRPAYKFLSNVVLRGESLKDFKAESWPLMKELIGIADAVEVEPDTPVYVFGNPALYRIMETKQAVPVPGWYWELAPQSLFDRTAADLRRAQPAYIFMVDYYAELVFSTAPDIRRLLDERYEIIADLQQGRWYRLR